MAGDETLVGSFSHGWGEGDRCTMNACRFLVRSLMNASPRFSGEAYSHCP
jgi:hypothetical protein